MTKLFGDKKVVTKRRRKALPLLAVQKKKTKHSSKNKSYKIWFGPHRQLEVRVAKVSKKTNPKTKRKIKTSRRVKNYRPVAVLGLSGMYLFSTILWSNTPPPVPIYSAPAPATLQRTEQDIPIGLKASMPVNLKIESVGIQAAIGGIDLNSDGTLEVPKSYDLVGWYKRSPTPGEIGPSIITGHVDSYKGPAVFWRLSQVKAGDKILVTREDKSVATFIVDRIEQFNQDNFPTDTVYGNISSSGLRLITCGGYYQRSVQRYTHNTVVFASIEPKPEKVPYTPMDTIIKNPLFDV